VLTDEQKAAIAAGRPLVLSDDQYTSGVRSQMESERRGRRVAEKSLADIAVQKEAADRAALEEQKRYQELYEKEKAAGEKVNAERRSELIRSDFLVQAIQAGVADPKVAYLVAQTMPEFSGVTIGEDGAIVGVEKVLKALVEAKPYLVTTTRPPSVGAATNPGRTDTSAPAPKTVQEAGEALSAWGRSQAG
jgi:hypothetical protein